MKQRQSQAGDSGAANASQEQPLQPSRRESAPAPERQGAGDDDGSLAPPTQPVDHHYDIGSGEEETDDGLDPTTEAVRQAAEGETPDEPAEADIPVFDRANRSERI
jgi:hypothetical protein